MTATTAGAVSLTRVALRSDRQTATLGEMAIVVGLPVTVFLERHVRALWAEVMHGRLVAPLVFNDARLLSTLAAEVLMAVALLWWLGRRGWRPSELLGKPTFRDLLSGAAL